MKTPSPGIMAAGLIGLTGIILVSIGAPSSRKAPAPISETSEPAPPTSVSARGFSLASTCRSMTLPTPMVRTPTSSTPTALRATRPAWR